MLFRSGYLCDEGLPTGKSDAQGAEKAECGTFEGSIFGGRAVDAAGARNHGGGETKQHEKGGAGQRGFRAVGGGSDPGR